MCIRLAAPNRRAIAAWSMLSNGVSSSSLSCNDGPLISHFRLEGASVEGIFSNRKWLCKKFARVHFVLPAVKEVPYWKRSGDCPGVFPSVTSLLRAVLRRSRRLSLPSQNRGCYDSPWPPGWGLWDRKCSSRSDRGSYYPAPRSHTCPGDTESRSLQGDQRRSRSQTTGRWHSRVIPPPLQFPGLSCHIH